MKIQVIVIAVAFLMISFLGFISFSQFRKTKEEVIHLYSDKQITLVNQAAISLESYIKERIKAVEVLADLPASRQLEQKIFLTEYKRIYEKVRGFQYIVYLNKFGKAVAGYPQSYPWPLKQTEDIRQKFLKTLHSAVQHKHTEVFSKSVLVQGRVLICLISPIYSFSGKFQGAILGILDVKECIRYALKPMLNKKNDYAWLLNGEGCLIYHPRHEDMLLQNIFTRSTRCQKCHYNFDLEKRILKGKGDVGIKKNAQTDKQLIAYAPVPLKNTNWFIAVSSPYHSVTQSINRLSNNFRVIIMLMLATIISGAVIFSYINVRRIATKKEIEHLRKQAVLIDERNAAESRYHVLVEQSPDPIFLCTRKRCLMINKSFERMFGFLANDILQQRFKWSTLISPAALKQFEKNVEMFIRSRQPFTNMSVQMLSKDGYELEVEISAVRFLFNHQLVYQGIIHDVTKTRRLERERRRQEHLAMIGEMSARISHEIKNPLASIQTGIQLLETRFAIDSKQKSYFERLRSEIHRVDDILKGLLAFAKDEQLQTQTTQVSRIIKRFEQVILPTARKQKLCFRVVMENDLPLVEVDEQKMEQVLWNLVLNAMQASKEGDTIFMDVLKTKSGVEIKIRDTGTGISEKQRSKIFYPFYSTRTQGSGLGLPISKKIVELHHGQLTIKSKMGHGTTAIVYLPEVKSKA